MGGAGTWWQQHNSSESELGPAGHHPRSLTSMLADSRRALPPESISTTIEPDGELVGESEFISLNQDVAPLFQARLLPSPARRGVSRDTSSRELLTDLFPTGFTSNTLSPLAPAAAATTEEADGFKPASARAVGDTEPELKGRQVWACLIPKEVPAFAVASSNDASDAGREAELHPVAENAREKKHLHQSQPWGSSHQPYGYSELHQPNRDELDTNLTRDCDEIAELACLGPSNAKAINATRRASAPAPAAVDPSTMRRKTKRFVSDGEAYGMVGKTEPAGGAGRERENDFKHALDRLVPRLMKSQERVKFLEGNLEQAKQAESGRNALVKQITRLEEEVKHARHRLQIHHAEALEWREKRQSLEADNERLRAELHGALGRNTRLETENRRKDALLAEVRKSADPRAENSSTFEAELRHKDQLLVEAERDKKQAWQATSASAETAKAAIIRAEAAVKEASDLRFLHRDTGGRNTKRADENRGGVALELGYSDERHGQSLTDFVMAAASADSGDGGPEKTRRRSAPTEASLLQRVPLVEHYGDRRRTRYLSPDPESIMADRTVPPQNKAVPCGQSMLGRSPTSDSGEGFGVKSNGAPRVLPTQRTPRATPHTAFFEEGESDSNDWFKEDKGVLSPPKETQEPTTSVSLTPGSGRRMRVVETSPPGARGTGREHCFDGDRQRHDSEGVKGALTGATPAWTDVPSSFQGSSSTAVAGSRSSGGGVEGFVRNTRSLGREAEDGCQPGEEAHSRSKELRDHAENSSTGVDGRVVDEVRPRAEGEGAPAADEPTPLSTGWNLQRLSPDCPAAGHRRGRDMMSSRRSSLSGAGVGVTAVVEGGTNETSPIGVVGERQDKRVTLHVGDAIGTHHGAGDDPFGEYEPTGEGAQGYEKPTTAAPAISAADNRSLANHEGRMHTTSGGMSASEHEQRRKSTGGVRVATSSAGSRQRSTSLANFLGNVDAPCDSGAEERSRREKRAPAPFATDAVEDELRPVRELERRLMLLQMETSQLEAEQSRLVPKASKTMQARVQLQKIDGRLASLASESSGLRRILREKPWRM